MKTRTNPRIAFDDVGDDEPALLFLPGWAAPRDVFRPLQGQLDHRALALDWRGHGGSDPAPAEFGAAELVQDALAVIEASGASRVVPAAVAHAGWIAIELRKRLGASRVPGVVLIDWMVLGAPPPFIAGLQALQDSASWQAARDRLFAMWTVGVSSPTVHAWIKKMGAFGFDMWARGSREIASAFKSSPVPLEELRPLACPTLHIYAQPADPGFLTAQQDYARSHPWFEVRRVSAASHFPTLEAPAEVAAEINEFARRLA